MNPQDAIDLGREAIKACFMVGGPILLASLLIGLLVGIIQAMTQVQDQTVSFVPKLICLLAVVGLCLPWLTDQMVDYSKQALGTPMTHFHGSPGSRRSFGTDSNLEFKTASSIFEPAPDRTADQSSSIFYRTSSNASNSSAVHDLTTPAKIPNSQSGIGNSPRMPTMKSSVPPPEVSSPIQMPHYHYSRSPDENIGG